MKKMAVGCAVCATSVLFALAAAGCSSSTAGTVNATLEDAPPVMAAGHSDRYATLGAAGCYGCHGTNKSGEAMMAKAPSLPADHLDTTAATSADDIKSDHSVCITCHVPMG